MGDVGWRHPIRGVGIQTQLEEREEEESNSVTMTDLDRSTTAQTLYIRFEHVD